MAKFYNRLNILIMPTDMCNMNCVYCFHNEHHEKQGKMEEETLRKLYNIICHSYKKVNIIWHGGEPLIMGLDFFKKAISMQKEYPNCKIENSIQTNLTLMNQEFAEFFAKEKISVGSSFDGLCNESLRGNTEKILSGRRTLLENGSTCGFIMVVSNRNIDELIENYRYFNDNKINYTINLYVDAFADKNEELALEPYHTSNKIKQFFDVWIADQNCNIHIDYFERFIKYILYKEKGLCKYTSCLGKWIGIRYNGDIVPCNRFFPDKYKYGNVFDYNDIGEALESDGFKKMLEEAIVRRDKCKSCEAFDICSGGCNNVALNENGISENNGISCIIFREVYIYIKRYIAIVEEREDLSSIKNPLVYKIFTRAKKMEDNIIPGRLLCE